MGNTRNSGTSIDQNGKHINQAPVATQTRQSPRSVCLSSCIRTRRWWWGSRFEGGGWDWKEGERGAIIWREGIAGGGGVELIMVPPNYSLLTKRISSLGMSWREKNKKYSQMYCTTSKIRHTTGYVSLERIAICKPGLPDQYATLCNTFISS